MAQGIPRSFVQQARYVSNAKYQPELDALKYIAQAARLSRDQNITQARASANYLVRAAGQAQRPLVDAYTRILGDKASAFHQLTADMNHVAGAADQSSGAMRDEAHIAADNLGLSAQAALAHLAQDKVQAVREGNYRVGAAQAGFDQANSQLARRKADIRGQIGAETASQLSGLLDTQRKNQFTAGQNRARNRTSLVKTKLTQAGDNARSAASIAGQDRRSAASIQAQNQRSRDSIAAANQRAASKAHGQNATGVKAAGQAGDDIFKVSQTFQHLHSYQVHVNSKTGQVVQPDSSGNFPSGTVTRHLNTGEVQSGLYEKFKKSSPLVIHAGKEIAIQGHLSPGTANALKQRYPGIRLPRQPARANPGRQHGATF